MLSSEVFLNETPLKTAPEETTDYNKNEQKETVLMSIVNSIKKVRQESSEEKSSINEDLPRPDVPRNIEQPTLMDALKNIENEEEEI